VSTPPADREFMTGQRGSPGGRARRSVRRAHDRLLDARLRIARAGGRLDRLAAQHPERLVRVMSIYRGDGHTLRPTLRELSHTHHELVFGLGSMGPERHALSGTVVANLEHGKFENLNAVLAAAGDDPDWTAAHWTLVVDDDVVLPRRFLTRFIAVCEHLDLAIAQPAQSLASFAAWPVTRRQPGSMARETRFVEIGPVTCFRRDAFEALTPFPPLRYGWGLDLHWSAVAAERGWPLGIVDALPVRHEHTAVAATYSSRDAIEEARAFLADRPFVDSRRASEVVRTHPLP
jgi:hypothetical protein